MVRAAPGSTLVIELGKQPLNSLDIVERVRSFSQGTAIIVVARSDQGYLEMPARELGAIAFVREPLTGSELARTVRSILGLQLKWAEKTGSV
jgi:DNA-binding response OmpR family regulator